MKTRDDLNILNYKNAVEDLKTNTKFSNYTDIKYMYELIQNAIE